LGYSPFNRTKIFIYTSTQDCNQSNVGLNLSVNVSGKLSKSVVRIAYCIYHFQKDLSHWNFLCICTRIMLYEHQGITTKFFTLERSRLWTDYPPTSQKVGYGNGFLYAWCHPANKSLKNRESNQWKGSTLVGHPFWNFIAERYGKIAFSISWTLQESSAMSKLLFQVRSECPFNENHEEWREYYRMTRGEFELKLCGNYVWF
jgi:hypothetical protein